MRMKLAKLPRVAVTEDGQITQHKKDQRADQSTISTKVFQEHELRLTYATTWH